MLKSSKLKIVLQDYAGNNLKNTSFQDYQANYPFPTAEYGHRDYFIIFNSKYSTDPEIYDTEITQLITSLGFEDVEEDAEGLFSFGWNDLVEREKIFNKLKSLT